MAKSSPSANAPTEGQGPPAVVVRDTADYVGQTLDGRYLVTRRLAKGGMGAVYLGRHTIIGRPVAIKVLHTEGVTEAEGARRLFREAQAAAAIGHPNIIEVLDVGVSPTRDPYLVMEYLEGEDLANLMRRLGKLSLGAACGILEPILLALHAAHGKGIIHRDLKPANIFLVRRDEGLPTVKLIDFGISKILGPSEQARLTLTGALLGTPAYMSPEQARGAESIDARADLYAVGVMLYQMVTGKLPLTGANYNELLFRIIHEPVDVTPASCPDLPEEVCRLIRRAISKDPADRFQSAGEWLGALADLEVWPKRSDELAALAACVASEAFSGGDLGTITKLSPSTPALAAELSQRVPLIEALSETRMEGPQPATRSRRQLVVPLLVGAVIALAVAGTGLWYETGNSGSATPVPAAEAPMDTPVLDGVRIRVSGAPEGATIYYDGAPVPTNPFRVRSTSTIVPLRIEASGYKPFVTSIVPSGDRTVAVAMAREDDVQSNRSQTAEPKIPPSGRGLKKTQARKDQADGGTIKQGARGALYSETFE